MLSPRPSIFPTIPPNPHAIFPPPPRPTRLQRRQAFNLIGFLKTPYGMLACFMLFSMFIMPKLKVREGGDGAALWLLIVM